MKQFQLFKRAFTAIVMLLGISLTSSAHTVEIDGIYYDFLANKTVRVTYKGGNYDTFKNEYSGSVIIPESFVYKGITHSVTSIGEDAFRGCSSLTSITIPNSVTSIGNYAFYGCSSLEEVIFNAENYEGYSYVNTFGGCTALRKLTIGENVSDLPKIFSYGEFEELVLNAENGANFSSELVECTGLKIMTIGVNVNSLPSKHHFSSCVDLEELNFNSKNDLKMDDVNGESFFKDHNQLSNVTFGDNVKVVPANMFRDCGSLMSVKLGKSVETVSDNAFNGCYNIRTVVSKNTTPPTCGNNVFYNVKTEACPLYVPTESLSLYKKAFVWRDFWNIISKDMSGVEETLIDENTEPAMYYNLNGVRVENPEKGIYIKKQGNKTTKVVM